jgi:hypothetical protein
MASPHPTPPESPYAPPPDWEPQAQADNMILTCSDCSRLGYEVV